MMISTLSEAGLALGREDWTDAAVRAADFLLARLRRADGRWMRAWHQDNPAGATLLAYGADHAHLVDAFTRLYEATGHRRWIGEARTTADALLTLFRHGGQAAIRTVGNDGEPLLVDQVDIHDGATPSTSSVAAASLLRLTAITGLDVYAVAAEGILDMLEPLAAEHPMGFTHALAAMDLHTEGATEIVISGPPGHPEAAAMRDVTVRTWRPNAVLAWGDPVEGPLWEGRAGGDEPLAYVCRNFACQRPVSTAEQLRALLDGS